MNGSRRRLSPWAIPLLVLAVVAFVTPVYIMFKVSFSSPAEVLTAHPTFWFKDFTVKHWREVIASGNLAGPLYKSLSVATLATLAALAITAPGAYVISRFPPSIRYTVVLALFFTRMFPDVGVALPIAVTFIKWNLLDTHLGLVLAHLTKVLPFIAWILVGTFETIPADLEQAAWVDGANRLQTLARVVLPLAAPGLAVAAMLVWLESWNEFTYALYLTLSENTLPLQTYYYVQRGNWFQAAAYSSLLTVPVMAVTFLLQRYLRSGYLSGSLKG
ncbi:MAG TPA: carbohydrate ABC transporter permease [Symbiobacteriaceae bacterium]|nr:carbohydrate ABC transporter permease [Symbiobacteriaceae bacterium]